MLQEIYAVGTVEGTGSAINVKCGFKPRYVKLVNIDSATEEMLEWFEAMGAGYGMKHTNNTFAMISTGGVSQYDTDYQGFTIGTDADVNASGETLVYLAIR